VNYLRESPSTSKRQVTNYQRTTPEGRSHTRQGKQGTQRVQRACHPYKSGSRERDGPAAHHDDVLPGDVDLEVGRDPGLAAGLGPAAVGLDAHEVDGERRVDAADEVGEEEERARGDADDDRGLRQRAQVGRELGGDLAHAGGHLGLRPQHALDAGLGAHHDGGGGREGG
jgi:hypothetical protein